LVECGLVRCCGVCHVGENIGLSLVEEAGMPGQLGAELVGNLAPLRCCGLGVVLGERSGDEGETTRRALLPACAKARCA